MYLSSIGKSLPKCNFKINRPSFCIGLTVYVFQKIVVFKATSYSHPVSNSNTSKVGAFWDILEFSGECYRSIHLKLAITFPEHFSLKRVIYIHVYWLFHLFTNTFFKMFKFNPLYYKKKPCVKISFDLV